MSEQKMTQKEAESKIQDLVAEAESSLGEAEVIADEYGISFDFDITYGAGATYYPADEISEWMRDELGIEEGEGAWISSSQQC